MYRLINLAIIVISLTISACNPTKDSSGKIKIVTTTGMIADAVNNIVGDKAEVTALMGPGVDPHLYKAAQGDLKLLQEADVIIYNGLHLEGKMTDIFEKLARIKPVYAISSEINQNKLRQASEQDAVDPHIWFDVQLWSTGVSNLNKWLIKTLPDLHLVKSTYPAELIKLNTEVENLIHTIPEEQRVLITAHDAFGYFGDAYHIEVKGLQGISTVAQAGLRDVNELVNIIVERKIKAVFIESSVPKKQIDVVIETCREKGHHLVMGGTLYSDAMGAPNTPEGTYIGMVRHNVTTIVNALK